MNIETASQATLDTDVPAEARDFSVKDRIVLVTGAGQGIGRELARQFAAAGSVAVIADLSLQNAEIGRRRNRGSRRQSAAIGGRRREERVGGRDGGGHIGGVRPR